MAYPNFDSTGYTVINVKKLKNSVALHSENLGIPVYYLYGKTLDRSYS